MGERAYNQIIRPSQRKQIFHPSIFRCCVRFRECNQPAHLELSKKQPTKNQSHLPTSVDIFPSKTRRRVQDTRVAARWCNGPAIGVFLQPTFWGEKHLLTYLFAKKSRLNGNMCHIMWFFSRFLVDDTFLWKMRFFPRGMGVNEIKLKKLRFYRERPHDNGRPEMQLRCNLKMPKMPLVWVVYLVC